MADISSELRFLAKDAWVRLCAGLIVLLALPFLWSGFGTATLAQYAYYSDIPLHLLVLGLFLRRAPDRSHLVERRFWQILAAGYTCWILVKITHWVFTITDAGGPPTYLIEEIFYFLFYLLVVAALELRPDLEERPPSTALRRLETFAGLVFAFGLLVYVVVIPNALTPEVFASTLPSTLLYVTADLYVFLRLLSLRSASQTHPWRRTYAWLLATATIWLAVDLYDALNAAGAAGTLAPGTIFETLWTLPAITAVAAARVGLWQSTEASSERPHRDDPMAELWVGRLVLYAVLLPFLHFSIEAFGLLEGSTRARSACLAVVLGALAALAVLRDRILAEERKRLEDERQRVRSQLALSQSMAAVRRLAGGIAHDFNNMLMVIRGHAEWLTMDLPEADRSRGRAQQIVAAADRAAELTSQLLQVSRRAPGQRAPFDLNASVRKVESMLRSVVPADIELSLDLSTATQNVVGDSAGLQDALVNLVMNARDAMPGPGRIVIRTRARRVGSASSDGLLPGSYGVVSVQDNGSGIKPEILPHIFEPFFTTKETGKGTGLGLSMVYSYAEQSGGRVEVQSQAGRGAAFFLWLPEEKDRDPRVLLQATTTAAELEPRTGTLLLVEDQIQVRRSIAGLLDSLGWRVLEARDGEEARQVLGQRKGEIEILLTDVVMPGMGGAELAEIVHRTHPEISIVFMTAFEEDALLRLGDWANSAPIVRKPCSAADLQAALDLSLRASAPVETVDH